MGSYGVAKFLKQETSRMHPPAGPWQICRDSQPHADSGFRQYTLWGWGWGSGQGLGSGSGFRFGFEFRITGSICIFKAS